MSTMHSNSRQLIRKLLVPAAAATLLVGAAACGDDDDDSDSAATEAPAGTDATAATDPGTTDAGSATTTAGGAAPAAAVEAFCDAELAVEQASASEDPSAIGPAMEALSAAAPAEIQDAVDTAIANAPTDGPPTEAFGAAYAEMLGYATDNCGWNALTVTGNEYEFGGLPTELPAGVTVVTLENIGEEVHEIAFFKVNDGVTETLDELLAMPEEEVDTKGSVVGVAFGFPGESAQAVVDLEPGRYVALCFLPQHNTPEMIASMSGPEDSLPAGAGPPHFMAGMVQEITVA
ncbi:MAG: hypothetical protein ABW328_16245 [Ilumatobacteraceae bacterium]